MTRFTTVCAAALTLGLTLTGCNEYHYQDLGYDTIFENGVDYNPYNTRTNDKVVQHLYNERAARQAAQTEEIASSVRSAISSATTLPEINIGSGVTTKRTAANNTGPGVGIVEIPRGIRIKGTSDYAKCVFGTGVKGQVSINNSFAGGVKRQSINPSDNILDAQVAAAQACMQAKLDATVAAKSTKNAPL